MKKRKYWIFCLSFILCALIGALFFSLKPNKAEAAANTVYDEKVTIGAPNTGLVSKVYGYATSGENITTLKYDSSTPKSFTGDYSTSSIDNGRKYTITTTSNKYSELYFILIAVTVKVPEMTTYNVTYSLNYNATRTASKSAAAASCVQILHFDDLKGKTTKEAYQYLKECTFYPPTQKIAFGGIKKGGTALKTEIVSGATQGTQKSKVTTIINGSSEKTIMYHNGTAQDTKIMDYFGFWVEKQYGETYANQIEASCEISVKNITTSLRVLFKEDDEATTRTYYGSSLYFRKENDTEETQICSGFSDGSWIYEYNGHIYNDSENTTTLFLPKEVQPQSKNEHSWE